MEPERQDQGEQPDVIDRTPDDPENPRAAHVKLWCDRVVAAKEHWKPQFERMRANQRFAKGRTQTKPEDPESYVVNITQRHIKQRTASLYARNPRVTFKRRPRLHGDVWDGRAETLIAAREVINQVQQFQAVAQAGGMPEGQVVPAPFDPEIIQVAQIVTQEADLANQINAHLDRIGRTLEIVFQHQVQEQVQDFKVRMKQQVRRALTAGVAYVKVGFQRAMKMRPEIERQHADITNRLAKIRQVSADLADGEIDQEDADVDALQKMLAQLEEEPKVLVREGLTFSFPRSTAIIPDWNLEYLPTFAGCEWVSEEFMLTAQQIQQVYNVHVSGSALAYEKADRDGEIYQRQVFKPAEGDIDRTLHRVWQIWSKTDGLVYTVCEGFPDFLEEPREPEVYIEQFWPWFAFCPNVLDDDEDPFPLSDVDLIRPMQEELNRSREGLREHRFANRPKVVTPSGMLSDMDKRKLQDHPANAVLELQALAPGAKVDDLLQAFRGAPIDPNLYETGPIFEDILRSLGMQEANLGGTNGATATENSIAESSRQESDASEIDDLDTMLTRLARAGGQILLQALTEQTIKQIAGPGAAWPDADRETIAEEVFLMTEAGSQGRPNQAAELQKLERLTPLYIQTPGLSPHWLGRRILRAMDEDAEIEDALAPGSPSILAINGIVQRMGVFNSSGGQGAGADNGAGAPNGDAQSNPAAQGPQGQGNAPSAPGRQSVGRPTTTTPGAAPGLPGF